MRLLARGSSEPLVFLLIINIPLQSSFIVKLDRMVSDSDNGIGRKWLSQRQ